MSKHRKPIRAYIDRPMTSRRLLDLEKLRDKLVEEYPYEPKHRRQLSRLEEAIEAQKEINEVLTRDDIFKRRHEIVS